jgi:hypothetical protein
MDQLTKPSLNPSLLDGWLTRARVAEEIGVSVDTLQRWETRRIGPPCVRIGRKVLYRADAFREWLFAGACAGQQQNVAFGSWPMSPPLRVAGGSKARNERGALAISKFKSIGRRVWPA